ncbi:MAG: glycoside hydrolase family 28 protein [Gammaproteobacteria bacterium]|nr:MAG: glycoside hydrolase family 28 protein [Gammaproteobacteria bacterium]
MAGGLASCTLSDEAKLRAANRASTNAWRKAGAILRNTEAPRLADQIFSVLDFGAKSDGVFDNTHVFARAIATCYEAGGGRVLVPAGNFFTGPIHLLSNVNLHLEEGAQLLFSTKPADYLPPVFTRWEGMELMGYSPLVYAYKQQNVALTGKGILNGQANEMTWWPWKGGDKWAKPGFATQAKARAQLEADVEKNRPVSERIYAENSQLRPAFVQFYKCKNILIENITITNAPFWLLHPVMSENVIIRGVTCASLGPNSDGCDPESCKNVVIENCYFDTGDDCIAIKSGRNADGRRIATPSKNIVIRGCKMRSGHGGVVIGSEISGGARNIFAENCEMSSPDLERGLRIKTNSVRGGLIENIYFRNIHIGDVQTAVVIDFNYEEGDSGINTPHVRNVEVRNLHCKNAKQVFNVRGYERSPISNLHLLGATFEKAEDIGVIEHVDDFIAKEVLVQGKPFSI